MSLYRVTISRFVLGPYFFDRTVNSQRYLDMLRDFAVPQLDTDNDSVKSFGKATYGHSVKRLMATPVFDYITNAISELNSKKSNCFFVHWQNFDPNK